MLAIVSGQETSSSAWSSRLWGRILFSPSTHRIPCGKLEQRVRGAAAIVQLWGEKNLEADSAQELVVLRLLGARGRAELATQDPADRLHAVRSITWAVNPPGFGASSGPVSVESYLRAVLAAYDFVVDHHRGAKVWVYGKSIGATGAMYLAAHRRPAALILKNIIDVPSVAARRAARWLPNWISGRVAATVPSNLNALQFAPNGRCPALFVISREDQLASPETQEAVVRAYSGSAQVLYVDGEHDQPVLATADLPRYAAALRGLWDRASTQPR